MKNNKKYANIYKTESIQKYYLNYFIRKLRLGKKKINLTNIWFKKQKKEI